MYEIFLTREAQRFYEDADSILVKKINRCFDNLAEDPYNHPNIKPLKGILSGHFRYRMGNWRVVFRVEEQKKRVVVLLIVHRKNAYR